MRSDHGRSSHKAFILLKSLLACDHNNTFFRYYMILAFGVWDFSKFNIVKSADEVPGKLLIPKSN